MKPFITVKNILALIFFIVAFYALTHLVALSITSNVGKAGGCRQIIVEGGKEIKSIYEDIVEE